VAHDNIARRAYERYEERGREPGHDMDDSLQAERDIQQRRSTDAGEHRADGVAKIPPQTIDADARQGGSS
jgi:hypothetical protein